MGIERLSQVFLSVAFFKLMVYWIPIMLIFGKTQIIQSRVPPLSISLQLSLWMFFSKYFRRLINEITLPSIQTRTETYDKTIRQIRAQNHLLQLENKANEILSKARKRSWRKKEELDAIQLKFTKKSAVFRLKCCIAEEGKGAKIRGIVSNSLLTAVFFLCIILVIMSSC